MHFIFFLHLVKEWSWYVCQESFLPCLNWILTPASFCIFLIISPFLPMIMPTANLGTTTWMKGIQKSFFSPFYLFFKKRNNIGSSLLSVIKTKLWGGVLHPDCFPPFSIQSLPCQLWSLPGPCLGSVLPRVHGLAIEKKNQKHKIFLDITNTAAEILYTNTEAFQFLVEDWRHKMCKIECKQKSQRRTLGLRVRPALCEDPQWFSGACLLRWAWGHPESLSSALLFSPGRKQSDRGQSHSETPGAKKTVHSERQNFSHFLINRLDFFFFNVPLPFLAACE